MKEEDKLKKLVGSGNPFRMPDGYLESLTEQVMSRLPEEDAGVVAPSKPAVRRLRLRSWLYAAAAMLAGAVLLLRFASSPVTPDADVLALDETEIEMEYVERIVDGSMLDNYDLYVYLADSETE